MLKTSKAMRKMCVLAGIIVLGATASAIPFDTHISIDRALNSPTLTIRYSGARAALVELRVNGDSIGTRTMSASKDAGETNFNVNLNDLKDGDNDVEVRLFDRAGKLIGSDKTSISTDQSSNKGPVFLANPKVGATVRGPVEIKLSFNRDIKNSIVSFFVDSNFKAMSNYPPYSYIWDTSRESNGWHEVEAWDVDESSQTYKTKKTRVFVDNPSGNTPRNGVNTEINPSKPTFKVHTEGTESPLRANAGSGKSHVETRVNSVEPKLNGLTTSNPRHYTAASGANGLQPAPTGRTIATGPKMLTPSGNRVATNHAKPVGTINVSLHHDTVAMSTQKLGGASAAVRAVNTAAHIMSITRGQRIPNIGTFAIVLNSQFVKFDVQPRVDDGVPMTPLRYLLEKGGGKVNWENMSKTVKASADGKSITIQIGDRNAKVDQVTLSMEVTPYLDRGRTIVPLSFIHDALGVNVEYDKETGHVLITSAAK